MSTVRVSRLRASTTSGATVRVSRVSASTTPASTKTVRVSRVTASSSPAATRKVRVSSLRASSAASFSVAPIAALKAEPFDVVSITAQVAPGSPGAATWVWRQVSGAPLVLTTVGSRVSFLTPAGLTQQTVVLGVTAKTSTGVSSPEVLATVDVYSHTVYVVTDNAWTPAQLGPVPNVNQSAAPVGPSTRGGIVRQQVYSESFTRAAALGSFRTVYPEIGYYDGFTDTSGLGLYAPDKVLSAHDGTLDAYLHVENGQALAAAIMPDNYAPTLGGRWDIRYKTSAAVEGFKFVGMLWPSSDVWDDGEVDWPEADIGDHPRPASLIPGTASSTPTFLPALEQFAATDTSEFHVASTEWNFDAATPSKNWIRFYWDDVLVAEVTGAANLPTKPMRLTLQFETWINQGPVPAPSPGAHVLVDWISKWV